MVYAAVTRSMTHASGLCTGLYLFPNAQKPERQKSNWTIAGLTPIGFGLAWQANLKNYTLTKRTEKQ
jgi:hypothetical protein